MTRKKTGKKWYRFITPFVLISVVVSCFLLYLFLTGQQQTAPVHYGMLMLLLPVIVAMVVADILLRHLIKKLHWLWIIEIIVGLVLIYWWIISE